MKNCLCALNLAVVTTCCNENLQYMKRKLCSRSSSFCCNTCLSACGCCCCSKNWRTALRVVPHFRLSSRSSKTGWSEKCWVQTNSTSLTSSTRPRAARGKRTRGSTAARRLQEVRVRRTYLVVRTPTAYVLTYVCTYVCSRCTYYEVGTLTDIPDVTKNPNILWYCMLY